MVEKICSHCGTTVLVGLEYCPGCLRSVRGQESEAKPAPSSEAEGTRFERLQTKWHDLAAGFSPHAQPLPTKNDPAFDYNRSGDAVTTSMSVGYTRVVCPKCHRPHRAPLDQSPSALVMCSGCYHQFPASMAAEFRKGADLICFNCGVTTFCVNGLKVNHCPNCKTKVVRHRDPEVVKLLAFASFIGILIVAGFTHAVATQQAPQFLMWLCIGTIFTVIGFVVMAALGF